MSSTPKKNYINLDKYISKDLVADIQGNSPVLNFRLKNASDSIKLKRSAQLKD